MGKKGAGRIPMPRYARLWLAGKTFPPLESLHALPARRTDGRLQKSGKTDNMKLIIELIRDFTNLGKDDATIAGGKGASLGEMLRAGISVPSGFVILANASEKFLEETDLNAEIDSALDFVNHQEIHTIEAASEKIKALILQAEMPKNITDEIQKFFKNLNTKCVAVRSSATAEDSASAAWAGQLESYLNTTEENLLENVKKCWASLFTPRAIFYRLQKNLHDSRISIGVVIQKMVESEKSGIAFSVHPVTQDRNQLIIEAGFGLGEAIVASRITPDSYVIEKQPKRIIDKNVQVQTKGLYRAEKGGNEWHNIPKEKGEKQILSDNEILELTELVLRIEDVFGYPVDIEWATENDDFEILQARPITTLRTT
jgi:pyruvate,water dikinase